MFDLFEELSSPHLTRLARSLSALVCGERFWFAASQSRTDAALLISPRAADPLMQDLAEQVAALDIGDAVTGFGCVSEEGRIQLFSQHLTAAHLDCLIRFTNSNLSSHPQLSRLCNARLYSLSGSGSMLAIHEAPERWSGVPEPVRGSTAHSIQQIQQTRPGASLWLWVTPRGPAGTPALVALDRSRDPDGTAFEAAVKDAVRRGAAPTGSCAGALSHTADNGRIYVGSGPVAEALAAARAAFPFLPAITAVS